VTHAWARELALDIFEVVARCNPLRLAGILVTAVHKEGQMQGPDLQLVGDVVRATRHAVTASGGVATIQDLRELHARGAAACVIGMALTAAP
jgi:phosphoribosylformimino-5-aminoimidazole carboxamide ribotide isomerase